MKKIVLLIFLLSSFVLSSHAKEFMKIASVEPVLVQKGEQKNWCSVCGMNLKKFYKTSYIAHLRDTEPRQYCSIRCLAYDMQNHELDGDIKVVDASTQELIDAKKAYYVVGSKIKGTMSKVSKLAFASKEEAQKFVKKYRGKIVDFASALKMAQDSLKTDSAMVLKKKKKKIYPMGKKVFQKMCKQDIDLSNYVEVNQLKADITTKKLCRHLKEKQLQAVALYLLEVKKADTKEEVVNHIHVTKDEKCPVCGMFVYKFPRWVAQIVLIDNNKEKHLSFDGVADMMKFYFHPNKWGDYGVHDTQEMIKLTVTDYYSQKSIDAIKAFYVIGSDIYGPMGNELIPFEYEDEAKTFSMDHKGRKVVKFEDITPNEIYELDE